jgi:amino acid adenylation domain-containing protein
VTDPTIHAVFEARAREHPDRPAVVRGAATLTYRELDAWANRTAQHLVRRGVRPGEVVGIDAERSIELIVLLLGVLKAGAAYLAVDRRQPPVRRRQMLTAASVREVLTAPPADEMLPDTPPPVTAGAESLAYVSFTSGSTGEPKGVAVPHRAVLRLVAGIEGLTVRPQDTFLQFAPIAFDASTFEVWTPLLSGARLAVAPPGELSIRELTAAVRDERVTVMWLTAGLFRQVVTAGLDDLRGLRYLLAGGDVLPLPQVTRVVTELTGTLLINGYGPTENTTFTCCHAVTGEEGGSVPIGTPIHGTGIRVLDRQLRPVPDGEPGELWATGSGLARGYLGAPAETAARFLADPWAVVPGERMYRTGDMVRRDARGVVEFIGRTDDQVKIRGFRLELGEVAAALAAVPGVAGSAVVTGTRPSGERRLVAYVVAAGATALSGIEVRRRLGETLPEYAVPSVVRIVDALPLTSTGKIDRRELAARSIAERPEVNALFRAPDTALERTVVQLWIDHLGVAGIGADDDFFEVGGHSLLAVTVIEELRAGYGVEISPLTFYRDPSPAGLARAVEKAQAQR